MNCNHMVLKIGHVGCWCEKEAQKLWPQACCAVVVVMDPYSSVAVVVTGILCSVESFVADKRDTFDDWKIGQDCMVELC